MLASARLHGCIFTSRSLSLSRNIPSNIGIMVPRASKADMALMQHQSASHDGFAMGRPDISVGPRRSSRRTTKPGQGLRPGPDRAWEKESPAKRPKLKHDLTKSEEGVHNAMEELREMEDSFRDATKRQKLAVNESSVGNARCSNTNLPDEAAAFIPRAHKANPDVLADPTSRRASNETDNNNNNNRVQDRKALRRQREVGAIEDDIDSEGHEEIDGPAFDSNEIETAKDEGARPPPVNSDYLPLPWKGRLGYACLNTYLRSSNPPVFSSRTCRIQSILDHRHPLTDPTQPEHPTKNRPNKEKPPDQARGQKFVEGLGLANARDIVKMIRWNAKYGIKFMRLSSEMFPFASHEEFGYKLAPFASEVLAEAGREAAKHGHRLTTHPGQFTQLGSPRPEVIKNSLRDLEYHDEMLTLLKLPEQMDKDAIMILHMGGVYGDKEATLNRFRANYTLLPPSIKARLVLENDDVSWTVHDLLPVCEELNIPLVLDYHHHNIMFDSSQIREGTLDIMKLYPRIKGTFQRKGITQKMHYSEPCPSAITGRQRRKHSPRVKTLPPCADDMDLMIEAKDKEQAVFELMRNFKLPGWDSFHDVVPYERSDENRPPPKITKKQQRKKKGQENGETQDDDAKADSEIPPAVEIPHEEVGMGGSESRVYWPVGMEEYLRSKKKEIKKPKGLAENHGTDV